MSHSSPPKRAFQIDLFLQADSLKEILQSLRQIQVEIASGSTQCVSGGCKSGWHFSVTRNPSMTAERYQLEVESYLNSIGAQL